MRWLLRGVAAVVLLGAVAAGALVFVLPRLAGSEATRERIQSLSRESLGRELRYETLDFGLLPPSLQVVGPSLAGPGPGAPPLARAETVSLRAGLWPLLRGELEIRSLVAEGLELHLVRGAEGFELPGRRPARGPEQGGSGPGPAPEEPEASGGSGMGFAVRRLLLRDSVVTVEDRTVSPAVTWEFRDVQLEGRPRGSVVDVDGSLVLGGGGGLQLEGRVDPAGDSDLAIELSEVLLDTLGPYLGERLAGTLGGSLQLRGQASAPALEAKLRLVDAAYGDTRLRGPATLEASLEALSARPSGPFRLDLSGATLEGAAIEKPAGTHAVLSGRVGSDDSGALTADDLRLELHNMVARGSLASAPKPVLRMAAESFDLAGWQELIPALALASLSGRIAIPELRLATGPLDARGSLQLEGWKASPPGRDPVGIDGRVELLGNALRARDLDVRIAEQPFQVDARVESLFETPRYRVDFQTAEADANALLSSFAGAPDRLYGPLVGQGRLEGTFGAGQSFSKAMKGNLDLGIANGRIVGVSLLQTVLGPLGARLAQAGRDRVGGDLQRFYGEQFESLDAQLRVEDGRLVGKPVSLVYQGYEAQLEGDIDLDDLALDLRGSLTIYEGLDASLARAFGAGESYQPRRRKLPLGAVRGKLGAPKVQLAGSFDIAAAYARDVQGGALRERAEKELGPGGGQIVDEGLRVLDGLLGGRKSAPRREDRPPADR